MTSLRSAPTLKRWAKKQMKLIWSKDESTTSEYYNATTNTQFSAQIGLSTNKGRYCWMICHSDFKSVVWGDESSSLDEAKADAQKWLDENAFTDMESKKPNKSWDASGGNVLS